MSERRHARAVMCSRVACNATIVMSCNQQGCVACKTEVDIGDVALQGRGKGGRGELEREPSFSFDVSDPYHLQTRLDMEAIGETGWS